MGVRTLPDLAVAVIEDRVVFGLWKLLLRDRSAHYFNYNRFSNPRHFSYIFA